MNITKWFDSYTEAEQYHTYLRQLGFNVVLETHDINSWCVTWE